uniref:Putative ribonuclease H-like domain-containing protein n=1 Tax=Tanacetum cinerariifolium TaxID=118510 RepID=A0A6L2MQI6_TANCI|nr:putative ribonuclease H-like domain-containing protein [Tanacetum cinerariifolium]
MRPFGCHVTILNTLDPLGKFDGKTDEGFLVRYPRSSKAFRVFNSRTRIVQETLRINFLENKPNVAGSGPTWLFDIDTLTKSMNYQPVTTDPSKTNGDATFEVKEPEFKGRKPESEVYVSPSSSAKTKKHDDKTKREAKGKSPIELAAGPSNTAVSLTLGESSYVDPSQYPNDPNMLALEDITYSDDEEDVGVEADFTNLETTITVRTGSGGMGAVGIDGSKIDEVVGCDVSASGEGVENMGSLVCCFDPRSGPKLSDMRNKDSGFNCQSIPEKGCFEDPDYPDKVYKVVKALYGLHQAPRAWYETLANYLLVYINDIIFGSTNKDLCKAFEKLMKDKFQMSSMGELTFFLDGKSASTPIDTEKPLLKDPDDASEGFNQIIDFLNASVIQYALTINPNIYVSCIKQFWSSVLGNKVNDVVRLQALIDRKKVIITEVTVREALRSDDAESIDCLPNEEIFTELSMIGAQVGNLSSHTTKYSSSALTQKVFANMRRVGKGFSEVETPLFEGIARQDSSSSRHLNKKRVGKLEKKKKLKALGLKRLQKGGIIAKINADEDVILEEVDAEKDAKDDEPEPTELQKVIKVVTTAKLMTKVVTAATITITAAAPIIAATITTASRMSYDNILPIIKKYFNSNVAFLEKSKEELEEEENKALKRKTESSEEKAVKKQKLDEEVEELMKHLQIVPNDNDDDYVYTEATPLALKVHVVDYEIHTENNKPHYKIIRSDETHQLFLSFLSLLRNFDREDLEML